VRKFDYKCCEKRISKNRMAIFADKPVLDVTIAESTAFLEGSPSPDGVRLKLRKKLSKSSGMTWSEALDVAPWSQVNRGHVARLIEAGQMRPSGQAEIDRAKADGRWDATHSLKNMTTPPDLQAAPDANPASATFHAGLTKSVRKKRSKA
jgi:hypothetical protein